MAVTAQDDPSVRAAAFRAAMGVLWVAIRTEPWVFGVAVLGSVVHAAVGVALSRVLGWITDEVILPGFAAGATTAAALAVAAGLLLGVGVLRALGVGARRFFAGLHQYRMQAHYRRKVARTYLTLPLSWHQRHPTGQLLSNANADVEASWQPLAPLPMAIGSIFMLLIAGVAMVVVDPVLAAVGFVIFPAVAVANVVYQRRLTPVATRAQALRAQVSEVAHESFDGALVVKTLGREDTEAQRFTEATHRLRDAQIRVGRLRGIFDPVMEGLPNLGVLAVLLVGVWRLSTGAVEPGDMVQVAYLFTLLALPARSLGWLLGDLPRSVVGWRRVEGVLGASGEMRYGGSRLSGSGGARLKVRDLSHSYADAYSAETAEGAGPRTSASGTDLGSAGQAAVDASPRMRVLHGVDFVVEPGRTVALVGPTGAGKSTLTTLLLRLVDPDSGAVEIDGRDVRTLARGEIARTAALVPQSTFVFDDTVRGNITLGEDLADQEVWQALRLARAEGFVAELPHGLDTELGERGTTLSGGQRQRLALARALVRRPRLLVLDDATSAVDPGVEADILAGLRDASGGTTLLVVASRRATIELADEVVYLEGGTVRDRGPHAALLERCPGYAKLVTAYERAAREREIARTDTAAEEGPR